MPGTDAQAVRHRSAPIMRERLGQRGRVNRLDKKSSGCMRSLLHQLSAIQRVIQSQSPVTPAVRMTLVHMGTVISPLREPYFYATLALHRSVGPFLQDSKALIGACQAPEIGN